MDKEGRRQTSQPNSTLIPATNFHTCGIEYVLAKDNTIAGGPTQKERVGGENRRR